MRIDLYDRYFRVDQKNELIIRKFKELLDAIEIEKMITDDRAEKRRHEFRHLSIRKGLNLIRSIPDPIIHASTLAHHRGIGQGIINRVDEIITTGDLAELKQIKSSDKVKSLLDLITVYGMGEVLAKKLYTQYSIRSVEQLKSAEMSDPALKAILPTSVQLGLRYHNEINHRISRQEIEETYEIIKEILFRKDPLIISEVCGSYRRKSRTSGDIDILICDTRLITEKDLIFSGTYLLGYLIDELSELGMIEIALTMNSTRFQGLVKTARGAIRRMDLLWVPYDSYWCSLLYFTGSDIFNRLTRAIALRKGFSLTNWGLYPFAEPVKKRRTEPIVVNDITMINDPHAPSKYITEKKLDIRSELEIFEILDITWLPPECRN